MRRPRHWDCCEFESVGLVYEKRNRVLVAMPARADLITFDDLANNTIVTNQYAHVTFSAFGDERVKITTAIGGVFAKVDIYQNFVYTATFDMLVSQGNFDPDHQDLSAYSDITKLVFHSNTDGAGTGYDNLSFDAGLAVPEPASLLLVAVGLIGIGGLARKSRP